MLATALHLPLLHFVSLAPGQSADEKPTIIRIDLAALGEPEGVEEVRVLAAPRVLEPKPKPKLVPEVTPPPQRQPEPESIPSPTAEPEPSPRPDLEARALTRPGQEERSSAAVPGPVRRGPRKGIAEGVPEGRDQDPEVLNRYITKLFRMIDAKKDYPTESLTRREEGTVIVHLTLASDGTLLNVTTTTGGPSQLVAASLKAVRDAAPFPPFPKTLNHERAVFELPVIYRLR
jgi:protein TonB